MNKLIQGDCLEVMRGFDDEFVDLTVTSPPYDNLRQYGGYSFDFEPVAQELYRITKSGGVVVWVVGDQTLNGSETGTSFSQALYFMKLGFNLHDTMIYYKTGLTMNHNRYEQEFEYMFVLSKGKPKSFNPIKVRTIWHELDSDRTGQRYGTHNEINKKLRSGKRRENVRPEKIKGNVWKYNTGYSHSTQDKYAFIHPAIFPEQLAKDHIISWSNEGDLVLDPFLGSGTTAKAAKQLRRNYIGIEVNPEYISIAEKRLSQEVLL